MGLVENYLAADPAVEHFYARHPSRLLSEPAPVGAWAPGLGEAVEQYQSALGAPKVVDASYTVIATGQQPGIFTGPLEMIIEVPGMYRSGPARNRSSVSSFHTSPFRPASAMAFE